MSKIASLYIPLLKEFKLRSLDDFVDRFYQRMSREHFDSILRSYRIAPSQHREAFVLEALQAIITARDETHTRQPSESLSLSVSSSHKKIPSEPITTLLSAGQVQSIRDAILQINLKLRTDIDEEKRQGLLSRKKFLEMKIPESLEEAPISVEEESNPLPLL